MDENPIQSAQPSIQPPTPIKPTLKFPLVILLVVGIAVAGYFASAYYFTFWPFEVPIAPIPTFTPRPSPSPTSDNQFEDWLTYQNDEFGFEFKYPKILNLEESGYHKSDIKVWASLVSLSPTHVPGEPSNIPSIDIGASKTDNTNPTTNIVINGVPANKYQSETEMGTTYSYDLYPPSNAYVFNITLYNSSNSSLIKNDVELFDQIISTFKITK